jgi:hypothetical protein
VINEKAIHHVGEKWRTLPL